MYVAPGSQTSVAYSPGLAVASAILLRAPSVPADLPPPTFLTPYGKPNIFVLLFA